MYAFWRYRQHLSSVLCNRPGAAEMVSDFICFQAEVSLGKATLRESCSAFFLVVARSRAVSGDIDQVWPARLMHEDFDVSLT